MTHIRLPVEARGIANIALIACQSVESRASSVYVRDDSYSSRRSSFIETKTLVSCHGTHDSDLTEHLKDGTDAVINYRAKFELVFKFDHSQYFTA